MYAFILVIIYEFVQVPVVRKKVGNNLSQKRNEVGIFIIFTSSVEVIGFGAYAKTETRYLGKGINSFLPKLYIVSSKLHGFGLFCKHALFSDTWLTEYSGEYLSHDDAKVRLATGTDTHLEKKKWLLSEI
jgi:hypothetical protein